MSQVGQVRSSVFAIRKQAALGDLIVPNAAIQFIPLREGFSMSYSNEKLESDELVNDIGQTKSANGVESVEGSHPIYLKHSGVEGQEPETGILYESILGSKIVNAVQYATSGASTETVLAVANGSNFYVGQGLLIKDGTNGWSVRNIKSITGNNLTLNFALDDAPATATNLGLAVSYIPNPNGPIPFSAWKYNANSFSVEAASDCIVTELSATFEANQFSTIDFSYAGIKYFYNPIEILAGNSYIDWEDDDGVHAAQVPLDIYRSPIELAKTLQNVMNEQTAETITVSYSNQTGKFTIAASGALFELLWDSGTNTANTIGSTIGFIITADDDSALSYISDNELSYVAAYTPSYDNVDKIIVKDSQLFIGEQLDNLCVCATSATIAISKTIEDVLCICEETGIKEKVATGREVTLTATIVLNKHDVSFFDALINNKTISAMLNVGQKSAGNFQAGKTANFYLGNAVLNSFVVGGDSFLTAEIEISGFVTSDLKDIYVNFL
jgi:hypothetical protein